MLTPISILLAPEVTVIAPLTIDMLLLPAPANTRKLREEVQAERIVKIDSRREGREEDVSKREKETMSNQPVEVARSAADVNRDLLARAEDLSVQPAMTRSLI